MIIKKIKLKDRLIGPGEPTFIIAEMSGNHNHSFEKAKKIIDKASEAGADAIKLQTYTADTHTINCDNEYFQIDLNNRWKGKTLYELYKSAYTPWEWHEELKYYAEKKGLIFFSAPSDISSLNFLKKLNIELYKIGSFEINHIPLLKKLGEARKPVILSRGLSSIKDINLAIKTLRENGCPAISILHCVSSYPATPEQMNIRTIPDIAKRFDVIPGLSDHTLTTEIAVASVALGAKIIEKHFTISRKNGGPDASFSLEPDEFKILVNSVRTVEKALGKATYEIDNEENKNIIFKKSIFVVKNIKKGEKFNNRNIRIIRPGHGLHPKFYEKIIGKRAKKQLGRGKPLFKEDIIE